MHAASLFFALLHARLRVLWLRVGLSPKVVGIATPDPAFPRWRWWLWAPRLRVGLSPKVVGIATPDPAFCLQPPIPAQFFPALVFVPGRFLGPSVSCLGLSLPFGSVWLCRHVCLSLQFFFPASDGVASVGRGAWSPASRVSSLLWTWAACTHSC